MTACIGGIDLGGTKVQAVIVDHRHKVLGKARVATPTVGGPDDVLAAIVEAIAAAAKIVGVETSALLGIGIGAPGAVDAKHGVLTRAPNLPGWDHPYPLAERVGEACGTKVLLGNDVAVAVLGERDLGAARDLQSFVGVWWGTGVGGGIVLDRELWKGRGAAGEIGHMVIQRDGLAEPNGLVGTMEAYAGRRNMEARARAAVAAGRTTNLFDLMMEDRKERLSSRVWEEALAYGDVLAHELIGEAVGAIAAAAANVVNILDLEAVILGGGLGSRLGQSMADRIAREMVPHLFRPEVAPPVRVAALGDLGGAIGAALLVAKRS